MALMSYQAPRAVYRTRAARIRIGAMIKKMSVVGEHPLSLHNGGPLRHLSLQKIASTHTQVILLDHASAPVPSKESAFRILHLDHDHLTISRTLSRTHRHTL